MGTSTDIPISNTTSTASGSEAPSGFPTFFNTGGSITDSLSVTLTAFPTNVHGGKGDTTSPARTNIHGGKGDTISPAPTAKKGKKGKKAGASKASDSPTSTGSYYMSKSAKKASKGGKKGIGYASGLFNTTSLNVTLGFLHV